MNVQPARVNKELCLRTPENTSVARLKAENKQNVEEFLNNYQKIRSENAISSNKIYNFDESREFFQLNFPTFYHPLNTFIKKKKKTRQFQSFKTADYLLAYNADEITKST